MSRRPPKSLPHTAIRVRHQVCPRWQVGDLLDLSGRHGGSDQEFEYRCGLERQCHRGGDPVPMIFRSPPVLIRPCATLSSPPAPMWKCRTVQAARVFAAFVSKFSPSGALLDSTFLSGPTPTPPLTQWQWILPGGRTWRERHFPVRPCPPVLGEIPGNTLSDHARRSVGHAALFDRWGRISERSECAARCLYQRVRSNLEHVALLFVVRRTASFECGPGLRGRQFHVRRRR